MFKYLTEQMPSKAWINKPVKYRPLSPIRSPTPAEHLRDRKNDEAFKFKEGKEPKKRKKAANSPTLLCRLSQT